MGLDSSSQSDSQQLSAKVYAVIISYHPDIRLQKLANSLCRQCQKVFVIDNGSSPASAELFFELEELPNLEVQRLGENTGIAHAQNVGIKAALAAGADFVLLSDQDSLPTENFVAQLLSFYQKRTASSASPLGAVGPYIKDVRPGGDELVYVDKKWGPRRFLPDTTSQAKPAVTIDAAFLLASGCLIPRATLEKVGLMNSDYFIDHVDLEWCLRARRAGYRLEVCPSALLDHSLGDSTVHIPGRTQPVHVHSPIRCYYLARNTLKLIASGLLPRRWQLGYLIWLVKYCAFNTLLTDKRCERARLLGRGLRDGLRGKKGKIEI